jgi:DNA polymerase III delta prime subunit
VRNQDQAERGILDITAYVIEQKGSVTQPAIAMRRTDPFFDKPRFEVRFLDRGDAEPGRPLFVTADPSLQDEILIGDVVVLSADGGRIIDVDAKMLRTGDYGTVAAVRMEQDFPYEVDLEGEGRPSSKVCALKWERLNPAPSVGDRVKVMGGIIHAYAPTEVVSTRFKKIPRDDLSGSDLHGTVPQQTLRLLESIVDRRFNPDQYPPRTRRLSHRNALLLYGPPGVGKTFTVEVLRSVLQRQYNNGKERIIFLEAEGASIEGSLVGSGPAALRQLRSLAKKAVSENQLPITFINEAGSLLRSREIQGQMLDGGSSLSTNTQFLSLLSGPDEIPGILIADLNNQGALEEATRQRFQCIAFPQIGREIFVEQMFKSAVKKEESLFEGDWEQTRPAVIASLDTVIGSVLVGSTSTTVRVGNLISGRLYEKVIQEALGHVDLGIYAARQRGDEPLFNRITPAILYHTLTRRAWSLFKCWSDADARERLVPELAPPSKARSISRPNALSWVDIEMPPEYDCRRMLDEMVVGFGQED